MANVNNDTDRVVLASLALLAERPFTIDMNTSMWEFVKLLAAKINRLISEGEEIFFYKDIRINDLRQILYRDDIKTPRTSTLRGAALSNHCSTKADATTEFSSSRDANGRLGGVERHFSGERPKLFLARSIRAYPVASP